MNDSGDHTRRARPIDPARFRALATGVGHTARAIEMTGAARAQHVADCTPPDQAAAVPASEGRPGRTPVDAFGPASLMASRRWGR